MQEDNSMVEKILADLEHAFYIDDELEQFEIIPIIDNDRNKSPLLHISNNIGLEMWCVKHVYSYIHSYLLKIRKHINKKLTEAEIRKINQLLIGAVLIQPDVSTFWNMRRELIELQLLKQDRELLLCKLVLSHKSKSNEAFSHRRWILKRIFKQSEGTDDLHTAVELEIAVSKMASRKVQNNYHAWTHRIWVIENVPDQTLKSVIVKEELSSSLEWVYYNVSEHSGFHYRQRLLTYIKPYSSSTDNYFVNFKTLVVDYLHIVPRCIEALLHHLLIDACFEFNDLYNCYLCVLLCELLGTCHELNQRYPGHEAVWYHRRFVLHTLFKTIYEYLNLTWQRDVRINDVNLSRDENIIKSSVANSLDNGEKCPKLFKGEPNTIGNTFLYKFLLKTETDFINANCTSTNNIIQIELARRHQIWLKFLLNVDF